MLEVRELESNSERGGHYNDDGMPEIEVLKLAYRIEAMSYVDRTKCIDLFSGRGALAHWYKRNFKEVITNDKQTFENVQHDYNLSAEDWIKNHLKSHMDFTYIDFDDEGCPSKEIRLFFETIKGVKKEPFVLAVTDGGGLNLKSRGKINLFQSYNQGPDRTIKATKEQYDSFDELVRYFITTVAEENGFEANELSLYRKGNGNVVYACFLIKIK